MQTLLRCTISCTLRVWDGSRDTMEVYAGEVLPLSYHEFDGSFAVRKAGKELICSAKDAFKFEDI